MILEPARGMRTSHCSKTYQLGPSWSANSACFRDFLRLITRFLGFFGLLWRQWPALPQLRLPLPDDAPSHPAAPPATPHQALRLTAEPFRSRAVRRRCCRGRGAGGSPRGRGPLAGSVFVLNAGGPNQCWLGPRPNGCPAVTYSPTPSRVQYHRRCGS
jgi:hypothetical protein